MSTKTVSAQDLRKRTVISFAVFFIFSASVIIGFKALRSSPLDNEVPALLRRVFEFNEKIGYALLSRERTDSVNVKIPKGKKPRVNGTIGLYGDYDNYEMTVLTPQVTGLEPKAIKFKLEDIKSLPKKEINGEFRCIEGWAEFMSFGGTSFRDFLVKNKLGTHSGNAPDWENNPDDIYKFVGLETPNGQYYVSIDMKSALNPNTLLAYEQNGAPLEDDNGAPLRLYIPNKYGVKNLKRIGKITFADSPLPDYWGETGYDWFIGL